jgi:hypothetical protein
MIFQASQKLGRKIKVSPSKCFAMDKNPFEAGRRVILPLNMPINKKPPFDSEVLSFVNNGGVDETRTRFHSRYGVSIINVTCEPFKHFSNIIRLNTGQNKTTAEKRTGRRSLH